MLKHLRAQFHLFHNHDRHEVVSNIGFGSLEVGSIVPCASPGYATKVAQLQAHRLLEHFCGGGLGASYCSNGGWESLGLKLSCDLSCDVLW